MPLLVDTWNVLHVRGVLPPDLAGLGLEGLQDLLAVSRYRRHKVTFVCDGTPPKVKRATHPRLVSIRYSGNRMTADELIVDMVRRSTAAKRITVVTSDNEIIREVRRRKCRTIPSEKFLRRLVDDRERDRAGDPVGRGPKPIGKLPRSAVEAWADEFGLDEESDVERLIDATPEVSGELLKQARDAGSQGPPPKRRRGTSGTSKKKSERDAAPLPRDVIEEAERLLDGEGNEPDR